MKPKAFTYCLVLSSLILVISYVLSFLLEKLFHFDMCCISLPEVAGVRSYEAVNVQADVGQGEVEDKEVAGVPHLLHGEEGQDADGVEEEAKHACRGEQNVHAHNHKMGDLQAP